MKQQQQQKHAGNSNNNKQQLVLFTPFCKFTYVTVNVCMFVKTPHTRKPTIATTKNNFVLLLPLRRVLRAFGDVKVKCVEDWLKWLAGWQVFQYTPMDVCYV